MINEIGFRIHIVAMMRSIVFEFFLTCFIISGSLYSQTRVISISTMPTELKLYQPFSCPFKINTQYTNPS